MRRFLEMFLFIENKKRKDKLRELLFGIEGGAESPQNVINWMGNSNNCNDFLLKMCNKIELLTLQK